MIQGNCCILTCGADDLALESKSEDAIGTVNGDLNSLFNAISVSLEVKVGVVVVSSVDEMGIVKGALYILPIGITCFRESNSVSVS